MEQTFRKTAQELAPFLHSPTRNGEYDIYPGLPIGDEKIGLGFASLVARLQGERCITIDGYGGVLWEHFRERFDTSLRELRQPLPLWIDVADALLPAESIEALVKPFLGGDDPLWGTRFTGELRDFFDPVRLAALAPDPERMSIIYGTGAALAGWDGHLLYLDVPKNEIQWRSRAGVVNNLGTRTPANPKESYKRFYFVDWPALNGHKKKLLPRIDTFVDEQRPDEPLWIAGDDLRTALTTISRNVLRPRPWFEPGPWGGSWMKDRFHGLAPDVPNYAWSFEMIAPENGLMLKSSGQLLEVSFDLLMFQESAAVLGNCAGRFGTEFPIRFDYLDTFDGGNLSIQCHPRPEYIRKHFGENFTQDECYYILDCTREALVYLGFQEDIDLAMFRAELERSHREGTPFDVEKYVNSEPAHRGDLFLIPNGTIHASGKNNLVLEISATPYIFTFKMYDWVRRDLEGNLRPLNIGRAYENLYFDRKGERVREELISKPQVIEEGDDWRLVHLPTHPDHFYDVHRIEFATSVAVETGNDCHVLNLVEGSSIIVETAQGMSLRFNFAETFVVPAAAGSYRMINEGPGEAKVVKAFVKREMC